MLASMESPTTTVELVTRVGSVRATFSPPLDAEQRRTIDELAPQYATAVGLAARLLRLADQWRIKADLR